MGYSVEYLVVADRSEVHRIFAPPAVTWFRYEDVDLEWFETEGPIDETGPLQAEVAPHAALFSISIKWTWLLVPHDHAVRATARYDEWFCTAFVGSSILRLDEFVREQHQHVTGDEWWQYDNPVRTLRSWLAGENCPQHYKDLRQA